MSNDMPKKEEMAKDELVWVLCLMMDCKDFQAQINKLSKPCLFRLFDTLSARGCAFSNIEEKNRTLERETIKQQGELDSLKRKVTLLNKKLTGGRNFAR